MTDRKTSADSTSAPGATSGTEPVSSSPRQLTPEAQRALAEAEARRLAATIPPAAQEYGGQGGPDPIRYGDWEKGGIASDF